LNKTSDQVIEEANRALLFFTILKLDKVL